MNGNERRMNEIMHPESALTSDEIVRRKHIVLSAARIYGIACAGFMVLSSMVVVIILRGHDGITAMIIAFIGIMFVIILGMIFAYNLSMKFENIYQNIIK